MHEPLQFSSEIEPLVRFVEETPPADIVDAGVARLRQGTPAVDLLRAAALAVIRSTELPTGHHGGAVHPIAGLHGCLHTAGRLEGEMAYLPLVQHLAVCNHHIQSPQMGPYIMPKLSPRDGSLDRAFEVFKDLESSVVHLGGPGQATAMEEGRLEATVQAFRNSIEGRRPVAAEQCLLWLLENEPPGRRSGPPAALLHRPQPPGRPQLPLSRLVRHRTGGHRLGLGRGAAAPGGALSRPPAERHRRGDGGTTPRRSPRRWQTSTWQTAAWRKRPALRKRMRSRPSPRPWPKARAFSPTSR